MYSTELAVLLRDYVTLMRHLAQIRKKKGNFVILELPQVLVNALLLLVPPIARLQVLLAHHTKLALFQELHQRLGVVYLSIQLG